MYRLTLIQVYNHIPYGVSSPAHYDIGPALFFVFFSKRWIRRVEFWDRVFYWDCFVACALESGSDVQVETDLLSKWHRWSMSPARSSEHIHSFENAYFYVVHFLPQPQKLRSVSSAVLSCKCRGDYCQIKCWYSRRLNGEQLPPAGEVWNYTHLDIIIILTSATFQRCQQQSRQN